MSFWCVAELKANNGEMAVPSHTVPAETVGARQPFGRTRSGTIVASTPAISVPAPGRTRSGTVTATVADKQGRGRSGTITPGTVLTGAKPIAGTGRSRSGTITSAPPQAGTVTGVSSLAAIRDSGISGLEVEGEILAEEVEILVDAKYDPMPTEDLVFSSAPNPDIEAESDDEGMIVQHSLILPSDSDSGNLAPGPSLSSPTDPLNIDPVKPRVNLEQTWEHGKEKTKATGKKPLGSRKLDSKGSRKLKLKTALGLNSSRGRKDANTGEANTGEASTKLSQRGEITTFSSDPIDFLADFDEEGLNKPYEGPKGMGARSRKVKSAASRL